MAETVPMAGKGTLLKRLRRRPEEAAPHHERRRSMRTATVYQVARMVTDTHEELCLLRDVSPSGLKAEVYCPVEAGQRIAIELKTEHRLDGEVVWADRGLIGVAFDHEVPVLAMLAHCAFDDRMARMRPPRVETDLAGLLSIDGDERPIRALNISLAGMKIVLDEPLPPQTPCGITLTGLPRRPALTRWARGGECGIQLDVPLGYNEFAAWRRRALGLVEE